eukprot:CAMPEP_0115021538 /NCGR_PEP_ID=MMETSP0216-20121206/30956_1 /TAXON_ID=223996 /ORGANISM="Protocruzia adherens, Strain Boccale" /LENGTH=471 /DNA_ID=CAMNT_0002393933 /DNA_START=34 /DNA_END=1450 /DNA_ORIENTATION=-
MTKLSWIFMSFVTLSMFHPLNGLKLLDFNSLSQGQQNVILKRALPGNIQGAFLSTFQDENDSKVMHFLRFTTGSTFSVQWSKTLVCSSNCDLGSMFLLPGVNNDFVFTGWHELSTDVIHFAKLAYATGAVDKIVTFSVPNSGSLKLCPLNSKFIAFLDNTNGKLHSFALDADLGVEFQFEDVTGTVAGVGCSSVSGSNSYYLTKATSTTSLNISKMSGSTLGGQYKLDGFSIWRDFYINNSKNQLMLGSLLASSNNSNTLEAVKYVFLNTSDLSLKAAKKITVNSAEVAFSSDFNDSASLFVSTNGNNVTVLNSDYGVKSSFKIAPNEGKPQFTPYATSFFPGSTDKVTFVGSYYLDNSAPTTDITDGAVMSIELERCGNFFDEYTPTITDISSLSIAASTSDALWLKKASSSLSPTVVTNISMTSTGLTITEKSDDLHLAFVNCVVDATSANRLVGAHAVVMAVFTFSWF